MYAAVQYAFNGDVSLAYQVIGDGPVDVLMVGGWVSNLDLQWDSPYVSKFLAGLAEGHRLIITDRRGNGLSERFQPSHISPIEKLTDDLIVVMDAAASERAVVLALHEGGLIGQLLAAAHPSRLLGLVLVESMAAVVRKPDLPWLPDPAVHKPSAIRSVWGQTHGPNDFVFPPSEDHWLNRMKRGTSTPAARAAEVELWRHTDTRAVLPVIRVPTVIIQDLDGSDLTDPANGRYLDEHIPDARLVEHHGGNQVWWYAPSETIIRELRQFTRSVAGHDPSLDRHLATVLFTDIVNSTAQAAELGDRVWQEIRQRHDSIIRGELARFRGHEIKTMGDGFLATFDGPARAVRCAQEITARVHELNIEIRAGIHIGEIEHDGNDITGIAVAIGARVGSLASPSEVLVSQTIKDLTAGAGLHFTDRGENDLKGVPGPWRLYAARG
jgi:class 3 adenylate cyclase